jgi:hypothetical protein
MGRMNDVTNFICKIKQKAQPMTKEYRKKMEALEAVLESLKWYFSRLNNEPSQDRKMLMADKKSPGLPIIIWNASTTTMHLGMSLEFDCQGSITPLASSVFVQCGALTASLAGKERAVAQLEIRLKTVQRVLELTLRHSNLHIHLLGYMFYSMNGNLDDPKPADNEFTGDVMIKFTELK